MLMSLVSSLKFISSHPLNQKNKLGSIVRFFKWQLGARLNPYPVIYPFTDRAKLIVQKGMAGATGNLYCGLHEFTDMAFLLHFLRPEDLFVDIGANIGSYTVLATGHVGARSVSIEPVPSTFGHLTNNISINGIGGKVKAFNIALGAQKGSIDFTSALDTVNHVASAGDTNTIRVPLERLDEVLQDGPAPSLLKIDVEGFETEVIRGAAQTLARPELKAIIIELNGSGGRYGYDEKQIHQTFLDAGFAPYLYDPRTRGLEAIERFGSHNTIYVRDLPFVSQRLETAPRVKVQSVEI